MHAHFVKIKLFLQLLLVSILGYVYQYHNDKFYWQYIN